MLEYEGYRVLNALSNIPLFQSFQFCKLMSHGPQFEIAKTFPDSVMPGIFQSWTFDPWIITPLLLTAGIYLRGWRELHRRLPRRYAVWRLIAFQGGLLTLFLALASPLHSLAELLLQFHMIQHLLLMMVIPPLLLLGAPVLPLLRGLPRPVLQHGLGSFLRLYGAPAAGPLSHPSFGVFACVHGEHRRLARPRLV